MNCVYIGDEFAILFWEIPYQIWKAPRTPKLERRLEEFLQLAHLPPMRPAMYASVDGDFPKILRGLKQAPPWVEKLRVESSPLYRPLSVCFPFAHALAALDSPCQTSNIFLQSKIDTPRVLLLHTSKSGFLDHQCPTSADVLPGLRKIMRESRERGRQPTNSKHFPNVDLCLFILGRMTGRPLGNLTDVTIPLICRVSLLFSKFPYWFVEYGDRSLPLASRTGCSGSKDIYCVVMSNNVGLLEFVTILLCTQVCTSCVNFSNDSIVIMYNKNG